MMEENVEKIRLLAELAEEVKHCQKCEISKCRTNAVVGEGNPFSDIMFIGEAPGKKEDETGRPFVGNAGKFLDAMLNAAGFNREDVYITNVVKTRPPDNRDPEPGEIANCKSYLERQIEIINPKVIVTLGRYSMGLFLPGVVISKVHGIPYLKNNRIYMPMYHPAATLHQPALKEVAVHDMMKLGRLIELIKTGKVNIPTTTIKIDVEVTDDDSNDIIEDTSEKKSKTKNVSAKKEKIETSEEKKKEIAKSNKDIVEPVQMSLFDL